jgi:hypothetical protein
MARAGRTMEGMDIYVLAPFVLLAAIVGACLWADWLRQGRKRRYNQDMAQWQQNEYLRQIAEQNQRQDSGA